VRNVKGKWFIMNANMQSCILLYLGSAWTISCLKIIFQGPDNRGSTVLGRSFHHYHYEKNFEFGHNFDLWPLCQALEFNMDIIPHTKRDNMNIQKNGINYCFLSGIWPWCCVVLWKLFICNYSNQQAMGLKINRNLQIVTSYYTKRFHWKGVIILQTWEVLKPVL